MPSGNYVVDALVYADTASSRWAWTMQNGQGTTLTYSFMTSPPSSETLYTGYGDPNTTFQALSASQQAAVRLALQAWADVSGLSFVELTNGQRGNLEFGMHAFTTSAGGYGSPPVLPLSTGQLPASSTSGNVWFNRDILPADPGPSSGWFKLLMHEVGHALGLKHPGNYSGSEQGPFLPVEEDNSDYSVMSYPNGATQPMAVSVFDIIAIQYRYGPDANVRSGNDTYIFGNDKLIWDGGGIDTVTAAGQTQSVNIDLAGGTWNYVGASRGTMLSQAGQVFIGYHTQIENASGGSGADTLRGNDAANGLSGNAGNDWFFGGGGNDVIDGGANVDTAAYTGNSSLYRTLAFANQVVVASAAEGKDLLINVEQVAFANLTIVAFPSVYNYIASHGDLMNLFGTNGQAGLDHFRSFGYGEGRQITFDGLDYIASWGDLVNLFGTNNEGGALHYIQYGRHEGRGITFGATEYIASYNDLINLFGTNDDAGTTHFIQYGYREGRKPTFNGLEYVASYGDLINLFGASDDLGARHYIQYGRNEGRKTTFNGLEYVASYGDLINLFGASDDLGARHYIQYGRNEGRQTTFDGLKYIASYGDLITLFGASDDLGATHFIRYGHNEGRTVQFNPVTYLAHYADLQALYGSNTEAATVHYITYGYYEGRDWH